MALRRRVLLRRQRLLEGGDIPRSLMGLLSSLRVLEDVTGSSFLHQLFRRIPGGDDRRWRLLVALPRPDNHVCTKLDALEDDLNAFADGIRQGTQGATQAVLKLSLSEEAKLGRKILGSSAKLHMQIVRQLKPVFAAQETIIEKRRFVGKPLSSKSDNTVAESLPIYRKVTRLDVRNPAHIDLLDRAIRHVADDGDRKPEYAFPVEYDARFGDDQEAPVVLGFPDPIDVLRGADPSQHQRHPKGRTPLTLSQSDLMDWLDQFNTCCVGAGHILDLYLLAVQCQLVSLAISELMEQPRVYSSAMAAVTTMSSQLVRLGIPLLDQLFCLVDHNFIKDNLFPLSFAGIARGPYWQRARQLIRRASMLDDMLSALDILILPSRIAAHDGGIKAVSCAHLCPDHIVTGGADGLCRIWDMKNGSCRGQLVGHSSCITWVSFSLYDTHIYSTSFDSTLRIWNSRTGLCEQVLRGHHDAILQGAISSDFRRLASASMDSTVRIWESRTGQCTHVLHGHQGWVKCVAFGKYGHTVVTGGLDRKVHIWVLASDSAPRVRHTIHAHRDFILDVATCLSPSFAITCSKDQSVRVWNMVNGQPERELKSSGWIRTLQVSPDGTMVATGSFDNCISIFRITSGRLLRKLRVHNSGILKIAWSSNRTMLCATTDGYLQIVDI